MIDEITRLAQSYTQEAAQLKDYQVRKKESRLGREFARFLQSRTSGFLKGDCNGIKAYTVDHTIEMEPYIEGDGMEYIWAVVPEYSEQNVARLILRRIGTIDGVLLLSPQERTDKALKISSKAKEIIRQRIQKSTVVKIRVNEKLFKQERKRLTDAINQQDEVLIDASARQLRRIIRSIETDLEDLILKD